MKKKDNIGTRNQLKSELAATEPAGLFWMSLGFRIKWLALIYYGAKKLGF